jgi:hypothetical protein
MLFVISSSPRIIALLRQRVDGARLGGTIDFSDVSDPHVECCGLCAHVVVPCAWLAAAATIEASLGGVTLPQALANLLKIWLAELPVPLLT